MPWSVYYLERGILGRRCDGKELPIVQVVEERSAWAGDVHAGFDGLDRALEPLVREYRVRELVYPGRLEGQGCVECVPEVSEEIEDGVKPPDVVWVPVGDDDVGDVLAG